MGKVILGLIFVIVIAAVVKSYLELRDDFRDGGPWG